MPAESTARPDWRNQIALFESSGYALLTRRRAEHLEAAGLAPANCSVIEAGSGPGVFTEWLLARGCTVTCVEARPDYLDFVRRRFPSAATHRADLNCPEQLTGLARADVTLACGILYHLERPRQALEALAALTKDLLIVETCLSPGEEEAEHLTSEPAACGTQAVSGMGCRPTRAWVLARLRELFPFACQAILQPDHPEFPLRWTGDAAWSGYRRGVFAGSRRPLASAEHFSAQPVARHVPMGPRRGLPELVMRNPLFETDPVDRSHAVMRTENGARLMTGELEVAIVQALGTAGSLVDAVVERLQDRFAAELVHAGIANLMRHGWLEEVGARLPDGEARFWRGAGVDWRVAAARVATTSIRITGSPEAIQAARARDLAVVEEGEGAGFELVCTGSYSDASLAEVNRRNLDAQRPWLLAKPGGRVVWIGPVFRPDAGKHGPCWECLRAWTEDNRLSLPGSNGEEPWPDSASAGLAPILDRVMLSIARGPAEDDAHLITFDTLTLASRQHVVRLHARCPWCRPRNSGVLASSSSAVQNLQSRGKVFLADGGHRAVTPAATLGVLSRLVSPVTGIVPAVVDRSPEGPARVFSARIPGGRTTLAHRLSLGGRGWSATGKGISATQAQVSCLAEAAERYCAGYHGDEPRVRKALPAWDANEAVDPRALLLFSASQYAGRDAWNRAHGHVNQVPEPFDPDRPIDWTPAWSLTADRPRYLPTAFCYINYPLEPSHHFCLTDSNGCAAGNTIEEAILQGLLELIERDAVALWWYNRARRPGVNLNSFDEPYFAALGAELARRGRTLTALDLTTDLGVPVIAAVSADQTGQAVLIGFGAHVSPRIAAARAATELSQLLHVAVEKLGDQDWAEWVKQANLETEPYMSADPDLPDSEAGTLPALETDDLREDVTNLVSRLATRGCETLVVDLTRPGVDFPVVRVAAPGLRSFRARFAGGRLYEVPVELGWLSRPRRESELNRFPFPL